MESCSCQCIAAQPLSWPGKLQAGRQAGRQAGVGANGKTTRHSSPGCTTLAGSTLAGTIQASATVLRGAAQSRGQASKQACRQAGRHQRRRGPWRAAAAAAAAGRQAPVLPRNAPPHHGSQMARKHQQRGSQATATPKHTFPRTCREPVPTVPPAPQPATAHQSLGQCGRQHQTVDPERAARQQGGEQGPAQTWGQPAGQRAMQITNSHRGAHSQPPTIQQHKS